jgi:hypothetical protein
MLAALYCEKSAPATRVGYWLSTEADGILCLYVHMV